MFIFEFLKNYKKDSLNSVVLKYKNRKKINICNLFKTAGKLMFYELREIKISIVKHHLNNLNVNKSFKDHLFNQLFLKDEEIHKKALFIKYLLDKKYHIEKISASFLSRNDYVLFSKFNLNVKKLKTKKNIFLPFSMILLLIHYFKRYSKSMRALPPKNSKFNPKIKYHTLIRAQTISFENKYQYKLHKTLDNVIIHMHLNFDGKYISKHQRNYIKYLNANDRNYFFYYQKINYFNALKQGIKIYFSSFSKNIKLNLFKIIIQRMNIDDYANYLKIHFPDLRECYTIEESRTASTYLNEKLKELKIKTINSAHGLGLYAPIVNYDVFYVFSKIQRSFYNGPSEFRYFNLIKPLDKKKISLKKEITLIFICSFTLTSTYKEVISYIEKIARKKIIKVYAKYHPETKETDRYLSNNIEIVEKIEDLPHTNNYLAVSLYSSYVTEILNNMPFLLINPNNRVNLRLFFPKQDFFSVNTYEEFKEKIENLIKDPESYYKYWEDLISLFRKYCF